MSNVIQFPGRKKETEVSNTQDAKTSSTPTVATAKAVATAKTPTRKSKVTKKTSAATVLAIILASAAVNQFAFRSTESINMASVSDGAVRRGLASVGSMKTRDAKWEKSLAERLASPKIRSLASVNIGRPATMEENLQFGTLEEKYTITYKMEHPQIQSILLQDAAAAPAYILDRMEFLNSYGTLLETNYRSAKLKSVETSDDKTIESYLILDASGQPQGEARFELDRFKRLLSLKVEPVQI